jgi:hypothetical protein
MTDYSVQPTTGLVGGATIQFAEGVYPDIGTGIAVCEDAFFSVEPCLRNAWGGWTNSSRYGVSELPGSVRSALVRCLRSQVADLRAADADDQAVFLEKIADWLAERCDERLSVSILGV